MDFNQFVELERRKVNQGRFRGRNYFIRFVKDISESSAAYGDLKYVPVGRASVAAIIADDHNSIFTPCRYSISDVHLLNGAQVEGPNEIVSFRGRFCEQARAGEAVYAAGTLERLERRQGPISHRLLLGNHPDDTLVLSHL